MRRRRAIPEIAPSPRIAAGTLYTGSPFIRSVGAAGVQAKARVGRVCENFRKQVVPDRFPKDKEPKRSDIRLMAGKFLAYAR